MATLPPPPAFVRQAFDELVDVMGTRKRVFELLEGEIWEDEILLLSPEGRVEYLHGLINGWADALGVDIDEVHETLRAR